MRLGDLPSRQVEHVLAKKRPNEEVVELRAVAEDVVRVRLQVALRDLQGGRQRDLLEGAVRQNALDGLANDGHVFHIGAVADALMQHRLIAARAREAFWGLAKRERA